MMRDLIEGLRTAPEGLYTQALTRKFRELADDLEEEWSK